MTVINHLISLNIDPTELENLSNPEILDKAEVDVSNHCTTPYYKEKRNLIAYLKGWLEICLEQAQPVTLKQKTTQQVKVTV